MGSVLAFDMPGSSLTIAFSNYLQDSAYRKLLVSATNREDAIDTVVTWLGAEDDNNIDDGYVHPDTTAFDSTICVNRVTASAVGPDRWIVTVEYVASQFTGFPSAVSTNLIQAKVSYEAVQVWCAPTMFQDGLPYGESGTEFSHPGKSGNQDEGSPPTAYIWNRPVATIQRPFSDTTNPLNSHLFSSVGFTNNNNVTIGGTAFTAGTLRFDGADIISTAQGGSAALGAITYSGTEGYTASPSGFFQQVLKFGDGVGETPSGWYCDNIRMYNQ